MLNKKRALLGILVSLSLMSLTGCGEDFTSNTHTYNISTTASPSNWNFLTYQAANDYQIISYINSPLFEYDYKFDDKGKIIPGEFETQYSACEKLEDVTTEYAGNDLYNVPLGVKKGYAYKLTLRQDLKWDDGTPITAEDYVYSMKEQLNPLFLNYRANSYYYGSLVLNDAEAYAKQGQTTYGDPYVGDPSDGYSNIEFADFITDKNGDYIYHSSKGYTFEGAHAVYAYKDNSNYAWGGSLADYEQYYFNEAYPEAMATWAKFKALDEDNDGYINVNATSIALLTQLIIDAKWENSEEFARNEAECFMFVEKLYPEIDFEEVGITVGKKKNELILVLDTPMVILKDDGSLSYKSAYNLSNLPLVKKDLYEKCKIEPALGSSLWTTDYNTTKDKTASFGPYMLSEFLPDKYYKLVKNPYWYGYHMDEYKGQYETDVIYCETIKDYNTQLLKFKAGELDSISIDVSVADQYKNSEQGVFTPDDFTSALQLQSNKAALKKRESSGINKSILSYVEFRKALSLCLNRGEYARECTTSHKAGYGLLNTMYYYDVENGKSYRSTDAAKIALCEAYGVDYTKFLTLDDAVNFITGYDLEQARGLVDTAYDKALAAGDIKQGDTVLLTVGSMSVTDSTRRQFDFIANAVQLLSVGTKLEGRLKLELEEKGSTWSKDFKAGKYEICTGGWTGGDWDPGYILCCYISSDYMYSSGWDTSSHMMTASIKGITPYSEVSDANGHAIIKDYDTRDDIYVATSVPIKFAFSGYTMDYYYKWYPQYFQAKEGPVQHDYYQELKTLMNGEKYALVTPEIKAVLKKLINVYYDVPSTNKWYDYWWFNCCFYENADAEETYTMSLTDWYDCLNGVSTAAYNWAEGYVTNDVRVQIIAALEKEILTQYYSIPLTCRYSAELISYKADYISRDYNTFMSYGGIRYLKYNYTDGEWRKLVKSLHGEIDYTM